MWMSAWPSACLVGVDDVCANMCTCLCISTSEGTSVNVTLSWTLPSCHVAVDTFANQRTHLHSLRMNVGHEHRFAKEQTHSVFFFMSSCLGIQDSFFRFFTHLALGKPFECYQYSIISVAFDSRCLHLEQRLVERKAEFLR